MNQLSYCLEVLFFLKNFFNHFFIKKYRGIARATEISNASLICEFFEKTKLFENFVQLTHTYHNQNQILFQIFEFFKDCSEYQVFLFHFYSSISIDLSFEYRTIFLFI